MGYNLHIARSEWSSAEDQPGHITVDEWRRVAKADPEFADEGGDDFRWTVSDWTFHYRPGRVTVKSPDDPTLRKIFEVARKLNATVQGDEGEFLRQTDRGYQTSFSDDFADIQFEREFLSDS